MGCCTAAHKASGFFWLKLATVALSQQQCGYLVLFTAATNTRAAATSQRPQPSPPSGLCVLCDTEPAARKPQLVRNVLVGTSCMGPAPQYVFNCIHKVRSMQGVAMTPVRSIPDLHKTHLVLFAKEG